MFKNQKGFTLVELLIATAVFSFVLVTAMVSFLQIGRIFYSGITDSQLQDSIRQISDGVVAEIKFANEVSIPYNTTYNHRCLGNTRYTFIEGKKVDLSQPRNYGSETLGGNFGLLRDKVPSGEGCPAPCTGAGGPLPCAANEYAFNNPVELLGTNMRLSRFKLEGTDKKYGGDNKFTLDIVIAYGNDDMFNNLNNPDTIACKSGTKDFCAVRRYSTTIVKGLNP